ncbi:hypothetical protein VUJ46_09935 [Chryseobacterium sp. MYb264]|uniref:hypothetical protein n=1 Tax=Chryseobacterium sp. MYb264 TaxID=2745153 RepID=UPI002E13934C|nr:hypothetical protein VUJ46_09935 [Chryseobacterium sp. MYb264]
MKNAILLIIFSAINPLLGQQTEGLKIIKESRMSMERIIPSKSSDSLAKNNLNNSLKQNTVGSGSIWGTTHSYQSDVQTNVNRLQNNVNAFNNNLYNRMPMQGQGIQFNKRK